MRHILPICERVRDYLGAAKLLGAGGAGCFFCAKDEGAAAKIKRTLTEQPPNPGRDLWSLICRRRVCN